MQFDPRKDYCTSCPDKIMFVSVKEACYFHDLEYKVKRSSRLVADLRFMRDLYICHLKKAYWIYPIFFGVPVAVIMFLGVRIFGSKYWD